MPPRGCASVGSVLDGLEGEGVTDNGVPSRTSLLLGVSGLEPCTCADSLFSSRVCACLSASFCYFPRAVSRSIMVIATFSLKMSACSISPVISSSVSNPSSISASSLLSMSCFPCSS